MVFEEVGGTEGGLMLTGSPLLSFRPFSSFAISFLARFFSSSALTENLALARLHTASSSGASFFAWKRRAPEGDLTGDEPQGTMGRVSFPPSFARTSKERRLGTRQGQATFSDTPVYMFSAVLRCGKADIQSL